jgi:hypothetical protein
MTRRIIFAWIFIRICFGLFGGTKVFAQTYWERSAVSADYFRTNKSSLFKTSNDTTAPAAGYIKFVMKDTSNFYMITSSGAKYNLKTSALNGDINDVTAGFGLTGGGASGSVTLVVDSTVMATLYDVSLKADAANPNFTGTVTMPLGAGTVRSSSGGVLSVSASDTVGLAASLNALTASVALKAPIASPTFTGTVTVSGMGSGKVKATSGALSVYSAGTDTADYVRNIPATDSARIAGTVPDGAITNAKLGTDAVTTGKILDGTILAGDLNADAVTTVKIQDLAVTNGKLASDAVTSAKISDGTIVAGDIATDAVTSAKILDATIAAADIGTDAVINAKIQDGAVTTAKIANGTILTEDQNTAFQAYDSDSTEYARRLALIYTGYMRGDSLVFTTGGITTSWVFGAPVFLTNKSVSGGLYIDSISTGYVRIKSTDIGQPDSALVKLPVVWR